MDNIMQKDKKDKKDKGNVSIQSQYNERYEVEYGPTKVVRFAGWAGNQPIMGTKASGVIVTDGGGPSVGFSVSFPSPFNAFSMSIGLGNSYPKTGSVTGVIVNFPDPNLAYKVYVVKDQLIQPIIVWSIDYAGRKTLHTRYATSTKWYREYRPIAVTSGGGGCIPGPNPGDPIVCPS